MVKAGAANFFINFTTKPTPERVVTYVGDCDEVERYLRLPEIPLQTPSGQDQEILHRRKSHTSEFSNLSKMARNSLAAPASPPSFERLFSAARKMHDDLKKSTREETLEDMLAVSKIYPDA
jgi:hypothetical protein